jgi:hypothetical protein
MAVCVNHSATNPLKICITRATVSNWLPQDSFRGRRANGVVDREGGTVLKTFHGANKKIKVRLSSLLRASKETMLVFCPSPISFSALVSIRHTIVKYRYLFVSMSRPELVKVAMLQARNFGKVFSANLDLWWGRLVAVNFPALRRTELVIPRHEIWILER